VGANNIDGSSTTGSVSASPDMQTNDRGISALGIPAKPMAAVHATLD